MRYKVGDRVRVRKDLEVDKMYDDTRFADGMKKLRGQIVTITEAYDYNGYYIKEDNGWFYWSEDMLEPVEYTYEDLCNAPVGTKVTFENGEILVKKCENNNKDTIYKIWVNAGFGRDDKQLQGLKDNFNNLGKIIKIEEPAYTTVYEVKEILDEKEKRYLSNIIKPFKDKVQSIEKHEAGDKYEYISFHSVKLADDFTLPLFKKGTMYKGMEVNREYSLEELNLS